MQGECGRVKKELQALAGRLQALDAKVGAGQGRAGQVLTRVCICRTIQEHLYCLVYSAPPSFLFPVRPPTSTLRLPLLLPPSYLGSGLLTLALTLMLVASPPDPAPDPSPDPDVGGQLTCPCP